MCVSEITRARERLLARARVGDLTDRQVMDLWPEEPVPANGEAPLPVRHAVQLHPGSVLDALAVDESDGW